MKTQKSFWVYLCFALAVGLLAAMLVLPLPKGGRVTQPVDHHQHAPAYHHVEPVRDDMLHRLLEAF